MPQWYGCLVVKRVIKRYKKIHHIARKVVMILFYVNGYVHKLNKNDINTKSLATACDKTLRK